MPRLLLIANPLASGFTGATHREVLRLLSENYEVESVWPSGADDSKEASAKAAANGVDIVVAMGGDGVTHHVANGLIGSDTALGMIPVGTTNVLAKILRLPAKPLAAAKFLAADPETRRIPVARVEGNGPGLRLAGYALFAAGIGLDAEVVRQAESTPHRKAWFGGIHYARSAAWLFIRRFRNRLASMRATANGEKADAVAVLTQVHWPYTYFGRTPLRLTPTPVEGLSALIIEEANVSRGIGLAFTAAFGRGLNRIPGATVWPDIEDLTVIADPPAAFQADGELWGELNELRISSVPEALLVAAPRSKKSERHRPSSPRSDGGRGSRYPPRRAGS